MVADIIQANYNELERVEASFRQSSAQVNHIIAQLNQRSQALQQGGWEGRGSESFSAEMSTSVLPSTQRLADALEEAAEVVRKIGIILHQGEVDAARLFQGQAEANEQQLFQNPQEGGPEDIEDCEVPEPSEEEVLASSALALAGTAVLIDGPLPIGDIIAIGLLGVLALAALAAANNSGGDTSSDPEASDPPQNVPTPPVPPVPANPAQPPGPGWAWRGNPNSPVGGGKGSWYNPQTGESLHPDLNHPDPIGPHWDYRAPDGSDWRVFPDGRMEPK